MSDIDYAPFATPLPPAPARALPWMTVIAGSMLTAFPWVAAAPLLPPCGLVMLLAWRLLSPFALRPWAAAPLGLADDLVSGQPLGSAVLIWSACVLLIELVEQRMLFRTLWQDWAIAAGLLAFALLAGRVLAVPLAAPVDAALTAQFAAAALLVPSAMRTVAFVDAKRGRE